MRTYCGAKCAECPMQGQCAGCVESGGKPFGGRCLLAECVQEKGGESCGSCGACAKKEAILALVNSLRIPGLPEIETLCPLPGAFVNLPFTFPDGSVAKLLDDTAVYLGTQVPGSDGRCFGLAADETTLMVCSYGENGADPELLLYRHTCA